MTQQCPSWITMLLILICVTIVFPLSMHRLCKYIKYRIIGSVSHIAIENANLRNPCTLHNDALCWNFLSSPRNLSKYPLCVVY